MLGRTGAWFSDSLLPAARRFRGSPSGGQMAMAPNRPPPADLPRSSAGVTYSIHPLGALDGILLYVTLNGEAVGSWFGATEELAAEGFARHLTGAASHPSGETSA